jgi:CheY-like chemotaxis protein
MPPGGRPATAGPARVFGPFGGSRVLHVVPAMAQYYAAGSGQTRKRVSRDAGPAARERTGPRVDVLIVGAHWQARAMLRALLLEEGWEVLATDSWPAAEQLLLAEGLPRVLVIMLDEHTSDSQVLNRIKIVVPPARVLMLAPRTLIARATLAQSGFPHVLERPFSLGDVAERVRQLAGAAPSSR